MSTFSSEFGIWSYKMFRDLACSDIRSSESGWKKMAWTHLYDIWFLFICFTIFSSLLHKLWLLSINFHERVPGSEDFYLNSFIFMTKQTNYMTKTSSNKKVSKCLYYLENMKVFIKNWACLKKRQGEGNNKKK